MSTILEYSDARREQIKNLTPSPHNARMHSKKQVRKIADSIQKFGFIGHVLVDQHNTVIAGHGRLEAARLLKMETVPILCISHLSPDEIRAYMIADNRLAELAGWDEAVLSIEFDSLIAADLDFDVEITGFDAPQIDALFSAAPSSSEHAEPPIEVANDVPAITQPGDLWELGDHRLYCGDALKEESYKLLLGRAKARLIFTDPPFNLPIEGHVSGLGKVTHKEFAMASGEMSQAQFTEFLHQIFSRLIAFSHEGSIHYCCMDWRHVGEVLTAANPLYTELKNICVWNKSNGGMGALYRSKHEFVFVYKNGTAPHINNVELGKHGRYRCNVWDYPGQTSIKARKEGLLNDHPTPKPVAMVKDALLDCSKRGDVVLDPFGGSGTTLIAAEEVGRKARLMELDPHYCDTIIRRWQQLTGEKATHSKTKRTFEEQQKKGKSHE